jgi:hypothetical protein
MTEQGWFRDPFGIHTDRWISGGKPTRLVRDDGTEGYDDPPQRQITDELVPSDSSESDSADDMLRADDHPEQPNYVKSVRDVWRQTRGTR